MRCMGNVGARELVEKLANKPPEAKAETLDNPLVDLKAQALVDTVIDKLQKAKPETLGHTLSKVET